MEKNLEILDYEDKKTKTGKGYVRFETNEGMINCFDKNVIIFLKKMKGKTAIVDVEQNGKYINIKAFIGETDAEVEVKKVKKPKHQYPKDPVGLVVELVVSGKTTEEAIEIVNKAKEEFE